MAADDATHVQQEPEQASELATMLEALNAAVQRGDHERGEALLQEMMTWVAADAEAHPSRDLMLKTEAQAHEDRADWAAAEACYREALQLAMVENNAAQQYSNHDKLAKLYALLDDPEQAEKEAEAALAASRRAGIDAVVGMALTAWAQHRLRAGDIERAREAAEELMELTDEEPLLALQRARAFILIASCDLADGELRGAERSLEKAWPILEPQADALWMAGVQFALALWWEATARLRELSGDLAGSLEALARGLEHRRHVAEAPQLGGPYKFNSLARALAQYSATLIRAGRTEDGEHAQAESDAIRACIGLAPLGTGATAAA